MTHNLADYHVPVSADVHAIDVIFVDEEDAAINPLGVKGVGEIGIVGTAAAIANAIYCGRQRAPTQKPLHLSAQLAKPFAPEERKQRAAVDRKADRRERRERGFIAQ